MTKNDDVEHVIDYVKAKEADARAWSKLWGYVKLFCLISVNVGLAGAYILRDAGHYLYTYCEPIRKVVDGIIAMSKGQ